jgi:hypothetical protein
MRAVLDASALVAVDLRDRLIGAQLRCSSSRERQSGLAPRW